MNARELVKRIIEADIEIPGGASFEPPEEGHAGFSMLGRMQAQGQEKTRVRDQAVATLASYGLAASKGGAYSVNVAHHGQTFHLRIREGQVWLEKRGDSGRITIDDPNAIDLASVIIQVDAWAPESPYGVLQSHDDIR